MPWPTWDQAATAALINIIAWFVVGRSRTSRAKVALQPAFREFALISSLYSIWRLARQLPFTHESGAIERARDIERIQLDLHLPTEISLQHFVISHDWLARLVNAYYATLHVPALIIFLVWLFVRHRDRYAHWRNGLVAVTLGCLIIRFVRVAPPRFLDEHGFVDLSTRYGLGVYGPVGTGVSDQFAAMPSIHVGWAAVVALGVFASTTSRWRWLVVMHLPATMFVVAATGHHWWLDGVVAVVLLAAGLRLGTGVSRRRAAMSRPLLSSTSRSVAP
ncbi:phosphatase PAP2 family protein, partial [Aeromicrobium sp.]|uniref:phosphatase PAP2 family protein n=1 Tax=Aeromicrobium sp. TaxID=1871063 RepID=UPI0019C8CC1C